MVKIPQSISYILELAANRLIALDPQSQIQLAELQGKVIHIKLTGVELSAYLFIHADNIEVMSSFDGEVDTVISGTPAAMLSLKRTNKALFTGDVEITGEVDTGKKFKQYLNRVELDWEELLSHLVGDSAAYQVGTIFRKFRGFVKSNNQTMHDNLSEYLVEESKSVAPDCLVTNFINEVDKLRSTTDRLDKRISILEQEREKKA